MASDLIDGDWHSVFANAGNIATKEIMVVSPFIQKAAVEKLITQSNLKIRVITRFNLNDFYEGVSELDALDLLIQEGAQIKGIRNLHAKVYVFDDSLAILTSANLTGAALYRNHEFGLRSSNSELISTMSSYFERLWEQAGSKLSNKRLANWRARVERAQLRGGKRRSKTRFKDYGANLGLSEERSPAKEPIENAPQWFVKLLGKSNSRLPWDHPVLEEVRGGCCHWACNYPKNKRPKQVKDGAVMFMGRMVKDPVDILVFGRAIGSKYVNGRDDASAQEIKDRPWKVDFPRYIRVRDAEFVGGRLENGVSLYSLMESLGSNTFATTARNAKLGVGNTNPKKAYSQQPQVQLTRKAAERLNDLLNGSFREFGRISDSQLEGLDWPQ